MRGMRYSGKFCNKLSELFIFDLGILEKTSSRACHFWVGDFSVAYIADSLADRCKIRFVAADTTYFFSHTAIIQMEFLSFKQTEHNIGDDDLSFEFPFKNAVAVTKVA